MTIAEGLEQFKIYNRLTESRKIMVNNILESLGDIFDTIRLAFPEFTPHGLRHVYTVMSNLDRILEKCFAQLDDEQLLCLTLGAIIHDIGMAPDWALDCESTANQVKGGSSEPSRELTTLEKEHIRRKHHLRSEEFVLSSPLFNRLERGIRRAVGLIAKGHREVSLTSSEYMDDLSRVSGLAFLTAALRLADELEIAYQRVRFLDAFHDKGKFLSQLTEKQVECWESHLSLDGWELSTSREVIRVNGVIQTHLGHRGVERVRESLRNTIRKIRNIFLDGQRVFPISVEFELSFEGLSSDRYIVGMDNDTVVDYLIDNLYGDRKVALREVIQNAVDACQLRGRASDLYKPTVTVKLDKGCLTVTDNGQGMNQHIINNYLTVAGCTFYNSEDFESFTMYSDYRPGAGGMYGIGVFSFFLLCDSFIIRTRYRERTPEEHTEWLETRFTRAFCPTYNISQPSGVFGYGTQVKIELATSVRSEIEEEIDSYLHSTFPRPRVDLWLEKETREGIGRFEVSDPSNSLHTPCISFTENELKGHALTDDGVFLGVSIVKSPSDSIKFPEVRLGDKRQPAKVCIEGVTVSRIESGVDFMKLWRSIQVMARDLYDRTDAMAIIDFPRGMVRPTLDKSGISEGRQRIRTARSDLLHLMVKILPVLKARFEETKRVDRFWRHYFEQSYQLRDDIEDEIDPSEGLGFVRMRRGDTVAKLTDYEEPQEVSLKGIIFEDQYPDDIHIDDAWRILAGPVYAAKYILPYLASVGAKFIIPDSSEISIPFRSDSYWVVTSYVLVALHPDQREDLLVALAKHMEHAPDEFHWWMRRSIVSNRWERLMNAVEGQHPRYTRIMATRAYVALKRSDKKMLDEIANEYRSATDEDEDSYNLACFHAIIEDWPEALRFLRITADTVQGTRAGNLARELACDPDLQQLQDKYPKEFAEAVLLLQNASGEVVGGTSQRRERDMKIKAILEAASSGTNVK